jgi:hypothetical protein
MPGRIPVVKPAASCFSTPPPPAGGLIEALSERRPINDDEHAKLFERHRWKVLGPNLL